MPRQELAVYPWCGHAVVMGNRSLAGQITGEILERFGKSPESGRTNYQVFVANGLARQAPEPEQAKGLRRWLVEQLGREGDLAADERIVGGEDFGRELQAAEEVSPSTPVPLPQLLQRVAAVFDVPHEMLLRRTRIAGVADARAAFCYLAVHDGGHSGAEIARMLRMSRAGVSIATDRGKIILEERPELREMMLAN